MKTLKLIGATILWATIIGWMAFIMIATPSGL